MLQVWKDGDIVAESSVRPSNVDHMTSLLDLVTRLLTPLPWVILLHPNTCLLIKCIISGAHPAPVLQISTEQCDNLNMVRVVQWCDDQHL